MTTWRRGRELLRQRLSGASPTYDDFFAQLEADPPVRVAGTEVHLASSPDRAPPALARNVKHNRVLHEQVTVVTVAVEKRPFVRSENRVTFDMPRPDFLRVRIRHGLKQRPNVRRALAVQELEQLRLDSETTTYVLGRETLLASRRRPGTAIWRELLFAFLARNAFRAPTTFTSHHSRFWKLAPKLNCEPSCRCR